MNVGNWSGRGWVGNLFPDTILCCSKFLNHVNALPNKIFDT